MNAIIYTRVSTDDQKENGFSLQDQERRLRQYCKQEGKSIVEHYQDDHSAKDFNRPAFQKMLSDIREKKIKAQQLVCVRADRYSRNLTETINMTQQLKSLGLELNFIENNYDLSIPENFLPYIINIALPQVENERRGLNTKQGMRQALRSGKWVWKAPKGYINDSINKTIGITDESEFIKRAFEEVALGLKSMDEIRLNLNRDGFKCCKQQFYNILRNLFYTGKIVINEWKGEPEEIVKGNHPPIISNELFYKIQNILDGRTKKQTKVSKFNDRFPLRGHLICDVCGGNLTASSSKGRKLMYHYYHCQNGCKERYGSEKANDHFLGYLKDFEITENAVKIYKEIVADVFEEREGSKEIQLNKVSAKINQEKEKRDILDNKFLCGSILDDDYKRMTQSIKNSINDLEKEKEYLEVQNSDADKHFSFGLSIIPHLRFYYQNAPIELKHKITGSIFPEKLIFNGKNYRTTRVNSLLALIAANSKETKGSKNKQAVKTDSLSTWALPAGLEPATI